MPDENRVADEAVNDKPQDNSSQEKKTSRRSRKKPELDRSEIKLTVGQLIAIKRRELHWSQEDLAWQSGVSRTQIGRIERDESDPVIDTIEALESALGIELYERFMSQKRERAKGKKRRKKKRPPGKVLERFAKELKDTGISEEEMMDVLDEAIKTAENRKKKQE